MVWTAFGGRRRGSKLIHSHGPKAAERPIDCSAQRVLVASFQSMPFKTSLGEPSQNRHYSAVKLTQSIDLLFSI